MIKLAIVTTHPVQYNAPVFKLLSERKIINIKVFYTWEKGSELHDKHFKRIIVWDLPLLEGYQYRFISNNGNYNKKFWDIKNPDLINEIRQWGADAVLVFGWKFRWLWEQLAA